MIQIFIHCHSSRQCISLIFDIGISLDAASGLDRPEWRLKTNRKEMSPPEPLLSLLISVSMVYAGALPNTFRSLVAIAMVRSLSGSGVTRSVFEV
jgi:hypothetical protein